MARDRDEDAKNAKGVTSYQAQKKMLYSQDNMVLGFVRIEKAFDTLTREMVLEPGLLEAEAMMVEAMYDRMKGIVLIEHNDVN